MKLYILIITAFALLLTGCGKSAEQRKAEHRAATAKRIAEEQAAFKVAVTPTMDCLPLFLLKDSMLYDSTKADIRLKIFNSHMDIDTALAGGSVQAAATELVRAIELHRSKHTSLRTITTTPLEWTLVGNAKNKITSLKALPNHMIAMTRFSATDWLSSLIKKKAKTDTIIFSTQINDVNVRLDMMLNNTMDAAWLPEPQATVALAKGNKSLAKSSDEGHHFGLIVFREPGDTTADRREAQMREFTAAYNRAVDMINAKGIAHFAPLIKKYMKVGDNIITKLPKIAYSHAEGPSRADVLTAEKIRFQKHTQRVKIQ